MKRTQARNFPKSVCLETSSLCNGRCVFCPYAGLSKGKKPVILGEEYIYKIIDEIAETNVERFSLFNNNEPLLDDRIQKFISYARKKMPKVRTTLSSNGRILTTEMIVQTIENGIDRFFISIPTLEPDLYKEIMAWELAPVLDAVLHVPDEYIPNLRIAVPKTKYYKEEEYAKVFGSKNIRWIVWEMEASKGWAEFENIKKISDLRYEIGCDRPLDQVIISSNGDVLICCRDWEHLNCVGNICENSLTEIWNGDKMKTLQCKLIRQEYDEIEMCRQCSRVKNLEE